MEEEYVDDSTFEIITDDDDQELDCDQEFGRHSTRPRTHLIHFFQTIEENVGSLHLIKTPHLLDLPASNFVRPESALHTIRPSAPNVPNALPLKPHSSPLSESKPPTATSQTGSLQPHPPVQRPTSTTTASLRGSRPQSARIPPSTLASAAHLAAATTNTPASVTANNSTHPPQNYSYASNLAHGRVSGSANTPTAQTTSLKITSPTSSSSVHPSSSRVTVMDSDAADAADADTSIELSGDDFPVMRTAPSNQRAPVHAAPPTPKSPSSSSGHPHPASASNAASAHLMSPTVSSWGTPMPPDTLLQPQQHLASPSPAPAPPANPFFPTQSPTAQRNRPMSAVTPSTSSSSDNDGSAPYVTVHRTVSSPIKEMGGGGVVSYTNQLPPRPQSSSHPHPSSSSARSSANPAAVRSETTAVPDSAPGYFFNQPEPPSQHQSSNFSSVRYDASQGQYYQHGSHNHHDDISHHVDDRSHPVYYHMQQQKQHSNQQHQPQPHPPHVASPMSPRANNTNARASYRPTTAPTAQPKPYQHQAYYHQTGDEEGSEHMQPHHHQLNQHPYYQQQQHPHHAHKLIPHPSSSPSSSSQRPYSAISASPPPSRPQHVPRLSLSAARPSSLGGGGGPSSAPTSRPSSSLAHYSRTPQSKLALSSVSLSMSSPRPPPFRPASARASKGATFSYPTSPDHSPPPRRPYSARASYGGGGGGYGGGDDASWLHSSSSAFASPPRTARPASAMSAEQVEKLVARLYRPPKKSDTTSNTMRPQSARTASGQMNQSYASTYSDCANCLFEPQVSDLVKQLEVAPFMERVERQIKNFNKMRQDMKMPELPKECTFAPVVKPLASAKHHEMDGLSFMQRLARDQQQREAAAREAERKARCTFQPQIAAKPKPVDEISEGWLLVMKDDASADKNHPDLFCVPEQTQQFLRRIDDDVSTRRSRIQSNEHDSATKLDPECTFAPRLETKRKKKSDGGAGGGGGDDDDDESKQFDLDTFLARQEQSLEEKQEKIRALRRELDEKMGLPSTKPRRYFNFQTLNAITTGAPVASVMTSPTAGGSAAATVSVPTSSTPVLTAH